jgi:hypothetical protein
MTRYAFARSKAKSMHSKIARNQNYDDDYANDSEDVHCSYSRYEIIVRGVTASSACLVHDNEAR